MTRPDRHILTPRRITLLALPALLPLSAALAQAPAAEPTTLGTVEVRAPVIDADTARQEASSAKIIVSREDLEKLDAATVADILRQLPGVSLSPDGAGRRGRNQPADRLEPRVVVDGEALPGGNRMALRLPVDLIERIEILRNSTAEFPSGPGGTINLILRDVPPKKTGSFRAGVSHDGDAFGGRGGGVYGAREGETGVLWMGFANSRPTTAARNLITEDVNAGTTAIAIDDETGRVNSIHVAPRFTRDLGPGTRLTVSPFLSAGDGIRRTATRHDLLPGPLAGVASEREREASRRFTGRLAAEWKRRYPGAGEASARISLQGESERRNNRLDTFHTAAPPNQTHTRTASDAWELSLTAKRSRPLAGAHLASVGLEARHKEAEDGKRETLDGAPVALGAQARADTREQLFALWAQDEWQVAERHLLTPGLRLQTSSSRVTDALGTTVETPRTAWLPSLHYLFQVDPRWNLRASVALTDQPPAVRDLSPVVFTATGTNSLANPDRGGNPALEPTQTTTFQLGAEHFLPQKRGSAGLNLYLRQISDAVQRRTQIEGTRYVERPVNVGDAREVSAVADFKTRLAALPALTLRGNASTSRLRLDDPAARQESPRHSANLGFDYEHAPWKLNVGGNLGYTSRFTREASATTQLTQGARSQLDLYAVKRLDRTLSLRLTIDNATRAGSRNVSTEWSGGSVVKRETAHSDGVRVVFLSLEGKL